jgi:hypothetical protein
MVLISFIYNITTLEQFLEVLDILFFFLDNYVFNFLKISVVILIAHIVDLEKYSLFWFL